MRTLTPQLTAHIGQELTSLTQCLEITRNDGVILRMTEFNKDLIVEGSVYKTGATFNISAIKSSSDLSVDNATIDIGLDGIIITKAQFERDLFKRASFRLFSVNWQDVNAGVIDLKRGWIGDVTLRDEDWVTLSLRGLAQALQRNVLEQYSPTCRAEFGDKRCGVAITPTQRHRQGKSYKTGDWVVVPNESFVTNVVLNNPSFERDGNVAETGNTNALTGWEIQEGSRWSVQDAISGVNGTYSLRGGTIGSSVNVISQYMSATVAGMSASLIDSGNYVLNTSVFISTPVVNKADEGRITLITYDNRNRVLQTKSSDWEKGIFGRWTELNVGLLVLPLVRFFRVVLEARKTGADVAILFDDVRTNFHDANVNATSNVIYKSIRVPGRVVEDRLNVTNFSFADNNTVTASGAISGWVNTTFSVVNNLPNLAPYNGAFFALGGDNNTGLPLQEYSLSQVIPLTFRNTSPYLFEMTVYRAHRDTTVRSRIRFVFSNAANVTINEFSTLYASLPTINSWQPIRLSARVPTGATRVTIYLYAQSSPNGSAAPVAFGDVSCYTFSTVVAQRNDPLRGFSAQSRSVFDPTPGAFTYDGDLIWEATAAPFGYDQVDSVGDRRIFDGLNIAGGEFSFYGAKITWLSGQNAGTESYVRTWIPSSKTLKLYVPLSFPISIGDRFLFTQGCNKTISDCSVRFNNAINFRGEPYLPGQEKALQFFANAT